MKQIRILALLLALALCLAGCGSAPASSGASSGSTSQAQGDAAIPQEALDDVVSYLTDGAYAADDVVATVGDTAVTAAQALYWTAYQQYYMTYYYYSNYGMTFQMSDQMEDHRGAVPAGLWRGHRRGLCRGRPAGPGQRGVPQ